MPTPTVLRHLFNYRVRSVIRPSYLPGDANIIFALFTPYLPGTQTLAMCRLIANPVLHPPAATLTHRLASIPAVQTFLLTSHLLALLHPATYLRHLPRMSQVRRILNNVTLPVHLALETVASQLKISLMMKAVMASTRLKDPLARITHMTITLGGNHPFGAQVQDANLQVSIVSSPQSNELIIPT